MTDTQPRKSRLRYLWAYIPDVLLIGALFWIVYTRYDANMYIDIRGVVISMLLLIYIIGRFVWLLLNTRTKRRNREFAHIVILLTTLALSHYLLLPRLTLAKEIFQYSRSRSDFNRLAIIAISLCAAPEADFEVDLAPDITERHGWEKARVTTDDSGAHFVILFNRPDPSVGLGPMDGTAFVYAQQKQKLGQRIDTSAAILCCQHYLGGGWLACEVFPRSSS